MRWLELPCSSEESYFIKLTPANMEKLLQLAQYTGSVMGITINAYRALNTCNSIRIHGIIVPNGTEEEEITLHYNEGFIILNNDYDGRQYKASDLAHAVAFRMPFDLEGDLPVRLVHIEAAGDTGVQVAQKFTTLADARERSKKLNVPLEPRPARTYVEITLDPSEYEIRSTWEDDEPNLIVQVPGLMIYEVNEDSVVITFKEERQGLRLNVAPVI